MTGKVIPTVHNNERVLSAETTHYVPLERLTSNVPL